MTQTKQRALRRSVRQRPADVVWTLTSAARLRAAMHAAGYTMPRLLAATADRGLHAFTPVSVACVAGEDVFMRAETLAVIAETLGVPVAYLAPARAGARRGGDA